jgi:ComF family protein
VGGMLADLGDFLLELVFPGRCLLCGEWLLFSSTPGTQVCRDCLSRLRPIGEPRCRVCSLPLLSEDGVCTRCRETSYAFSRNHSLFAYEGEMKRMVSLYKFSGRSRLAGLFARFLAPELKSRFDGFAVVPTPPRPGRAGVDHVERIARKLEREHGFHVVRALVRTGGVSQKSLDFQERKRNLQGMIGVRGGVRTPERAAVLDDVFTTGATADACATALREGGCREIAAITLAIDI